MTRNELTNEERHRMLNEPYATTAGRFFASLTLPESVPTFRLATHQAAALAVFTLTNGAILL